MKVTLVAPHVEHAHTGETSSLEAFAHNLKKRGVTVRTIIPPLGPALGGGEQAFRKFERIVSILRGLRHDPDPPDLYHVMLPTPALARAIPSSLPRPVIATFEGILVGKEWKTLVRNFGLDVPYALARLGINNSVMARWRTDASRVVVPTEYQKRELVAIGYPEERVAVIPNLVRPKFLDFDWDREKCLESLMLDPSRRYVTYLGHFLPSKGVEDLIEAFSRICPALPDVDLLLAWSGVGYGRQIERLLTKRGLCHRIRVLGPLDPRIVLRPSVAVVFPYRTLHGHSLIPAGILEAVAVGTPVIAPEHPLLAEIPGGLEMYPMHSLPGLAGAVTRLVRDDARRAELSEQGRSLFSGVYAPQTLTDRFLEVYRGVVEEQLR